MSKDAIVISNVYASESSLLTNQQKFRGGFVCNVHPDNLELMRQTAKELGVEIKEGYPRRASETTNFIGIYTDLDKHDPRVLLDRYFSVLVQTKLSVRGDANVAPKQPRRRSLKRASRTR